MPKCDNCEKTIARKSPILECNKCSKIVHANQACTGLSSKQLAALRFGENLDWSCEECRKESPQRKSFSILEEGEEDEDEIDMGQTSECSSNAMKKLLSDISSEVKKAVKKEITSVNEALNSCCKKMDEMMDTLEIFSGKIRELEKKNTYLINQNKHLELKVDAMEQYMGNIEQKQLNNIVEIVGLPEIPNESTEDISVRLTTKLNVEKKSIVTVNRLRGRNGKEGIIQVTLNKEDHVDLWVRAARKGSITVEDIVSCVDPAMAKSEVLLRRTLSSANKALLWQAKLKLKDTHKYIWFQNGRILIRKNENDKPTIIKCTEDIEKITAQTTKRR